MIAKDKLAHFALSAAATLAGGFLLGPRWEVPAAVLLVGALKELVWDLWLGRGHPGWDDMAANAIGVALGWWLLGVLL